MEEEKVELKNKDVIFTESDYATKNELVNPFLYRRSEQNKFISIEDFALMYRVKLFKKREIVFLRSIIRNDSIKKSKRARVFNKYLKQQKKDFKESIVKQTEENTSKLTTFKELSINKVKFKTKFIVFIIAILSIFMTMLYFTKFTNLLNIGFITTINTHIKSRINFYFILLPIGACLSAIGYLIYLISFTKDNKENRKLQTKNFKNFEKYLDASKKSFRKCYNRIRKYYNKNIRNNNLSYEALSLDEMWDLKIDYQDANTINDELEKNNLRLEKKNRSFKKINGLLSFLTYAFNAALLIYLIVCIFI